MKKYLTSKKLLAVAMGIMLAQPFLVQAEVAAVPATNTAINARDASGDTLTPFDQGESEEDIAITAAVRRAVVKDRSLSTTAQNVKIITRDREVMLRGPVKSKAEKARIFKYAKKVKGVKKVINELEIEARH